jgi:hypothetical protein
MSSRLQLAIWVCATALFAGLYILRPRVETHEIVREVPHDVVREVTVTKEVKVPVEVVKEVPVEKIVQVDKPIPADYVAAYAFSDAVRRAASLSSDNCLTGVSSVRVNVTVPQVISQYVNEDEVRTKVELTLRQSGVPVRSESPFWIYYVIDALKPDDPSYQYLIVYTTTTSLGEDGYLLQRNNGVYHTVVGTYQSGHFGYAGTQKIHDAILDSAKIEAERFANTWLRVNQK